MTLLNKQIFDQSVEYVLTATKPTVDSCYYQSKDMFHKQVFKQIYDSIKQQVIHQGIESIYNNTQFWLIDQLTKERQKKLHD